MLVLGLTGGIGSGKTTVARIFQEFGVPVYNSDERAKWLMNNDPILRSKIVELFGKGSYHEDGLNRKFIASKAFTNKTLLAQLNALVHPVVGRDFENWKKEQNKDVVIKEAAILIESGAYKQVDKVVVVSAPKPIRVDRVIARDSISEQEVVNRMNNQLSDEERLKYADFEIVNDGNKMLIPQIKQLLSKLNS